MVTGQCSQSSHRLLLTHDRNFLQLRHLAWPEILAGESSASSVQCFYKLCQAAGWVRWSFLKIASTNLSMQRARIAYSYTYHHTVLHNHGLVIIIVGPLCGVLHNHFITLIAPLPGVDLSDAGRDHGALHSSTGSVRPVSRTPFKPTSWSTVILTISDNYHWWLWSSLIMIIVVWHHHYHHWLQRMS